MRVRLTLEQKRLLRAHHAAHPELTRRELCEWAAAAFRLHRPLAKSTLADTPKDDTQRSITLPATRKSSHVARFPLVEAALVTWVRRCEALKLAVVTGATIMYKAEKIRCKLLPTLDAGAAVNLTAMRFGKDWLYRFQSRHELEPRRVHGEASSVKTAAVASGQEELRCNRAFPSYSAQYTE